MIYLKSLEDAAYFEEYKKSLANRKGDTSILSQIVEKNQVRKKAINEAETKKAQQNKAGEVIALKKRNKEDANVELSQMQDLSQEVKGLEKKSQRHRRRATWVTGRAPKQMSLLGSRGDE